jgi:ABC-type Na+ efflux pump permease subunit
MAKKWINWAKARAILSITPLALAPSVAIAIVSTNAFLEAAVALFGLTVAANPATLLALGIIAGSFFFIGTFFILSLTFAEITRDASWENIKQNIKIYFQPEHFT